MRGLKSLTLLAITALSFPVLAAPADGSDPVKYDLKIDKQSLSTALQEFATQSGVQIIFFAKVTDGHEAPYLKGKYTAADAVARLLDHSDLTFIQLNPQTIQVEPKAAVNDLKQTAGSSFIAPNLTRAASDPASPRQAGPQSPSSPENTQPGQNQTTASSSSSAGKDREPRIEEVIVTARKRAENLQKVPDAVTVFGSDKIERTGIERLGDFMSLTPNLNFQDGSAFSSGYIFISMRGIANGQQGWAPVTFTVDGVRVASLDAINLGSLVDVERIEVLRGPQSALYGAGAIAGAINVVTKQPSNDLELKAKGGYGKGNDRKFSGLVSGAIVPDRLFYRLNVAYRDTDGLINSASNGLHLEFQKQLQLDGRTIFKPTDELSFDLRIHHVQETDPSTYQDKIAGPQFLNVFNDTTAARRRFAGQEHRNGTAYSFKLNWDLDAATLTSVTGYSKLRQNALASTCFDDPDHPAVDTDPTTPGIQVGCLFGPALGSAAGPGQNVDELYDSRDDFETITHDMRISSNQDGSLHWMVGGELMHRKTLDGYDLGFIVAPPGGTGADVICCQPLVHTFGRWDARRDFWWGAYTQLSYDITEKVELTFAGRYDDVKNESTQYTDRTQAVVVQNLDPNGLLVDTLEHRDDAFQPKVQLRYNWTDDVSSYLSWSKGFRSGFFNSGEFTLAEHTTNYEGGIKTQWPDAHLIANLAVFHIDYSDQQFSTIIPTPPFRVTQTIPKTKIDGVELESSLRVSSSLSLSAGAGYLDSEQSGGGRSPLAPLWSANVVADFVQPLGNALNFKFNAAYNFQSSQYLDRDELYRVNANSFLNLRTGVANDHWEATFWVRNATNRRTAQAQFSPFAGAYIRYQNLPVSYGVEVGYRL